MPKFLLALRDDDPSSYANFTPEQFQELLGRYNAWAGPLVERGKLVSGQKLTDSAGRVLARKGGDVKVTDGPYGETKEVLGGFYLIRAESYDEAVELCRDHPQLDFGTIEVREIDLMGQPDEDG